MKKQNKLLKNKNKNKEYIKAKCAGTTLIELMVVIGIISLVILGLVTFFSGGTRSWISGQSQLQAQREARLAIDQMVKEIRNADKVLEGNENMVRLSFPDKLHDNGERVFPLLEIKFYLDADNRIMRQVKKENGSTGENILLDNILDKPAEKGFKIKYLKIEDQGQIEVADPTKASKINLTLKVDVDNDKNSDIDIKTDVVLRNSRS